MIWYYGITLCNIDFRWSSSPNVTGNDFSICGQMSLSLRGHVGQSLVMFFSENGYFLAVHNLDRSYVQCQFCLVSNILPSLCRLLLMMVSSFGIFGS
jgi:hypothetical protein